MNVNAGVHEWLEPMAQVNDKWLKSEFSLGEEGIRIWLKSIRAAKLYLA